MNEHESEEMVQFSPRKKENKSDDKWKSKSLNSLPIEHYIINIKDKSKKEQKVPDKKKPSKKEDTPSEDKQLNQQELLPSPKISKINQTTFCISLERELNIFYMPTKEEKAKRKIKKVFAEELKHQINSQEKIEFVTGNNTNHIFVLTKNHLYVFQICLDHDEKRYLKEKLSKNIPDLRIVTTLSRELIIVSSNKIYQYTLGEKCELVAQKQIEFEKPEDQKTFRFLNSVGIVVSSSTSLFYFGSMIEEHMDVSKLKGVPGETPRVLRSESLYLVNFQIIHSSGADVSSSVNNMTVSQIAETKIQSIQAKIFPIDFIFEIGIFTRSKIYEIESQTFLLSLHEEVILIKKNFNRFIVWDNVSVVSSKSQSKKGQLVLADQKILVYSENLQIFAHEIFFNEEQSKLNMPPIDSFRGNDNDEEILYDAVLLEYEKDSMMKILLYINPLRIIYSNNESNFKKIETDPNKVKEEVNTLDFSVICINQSDPKSKLEQLLSKGKTAEEIEIFCKRFNISVQERTKCMWSVSEKSIKDIQNILLEIQDDEFIQRELDNILKKEPHNLNDLITVENTQISRLTKLLVSKLLSSTDPEFESDDKQRKCVQYINKIIQWLMESKMFKKKLEYSQNFLAFKEYDFIEIGKLKAASLKEEIKLLSCKKYQKRLKYFLNSFKILAIANYEEVFDFLLIHKKEEEVEDFIKQFRFILPNFIEPSEVFIKQKDYKVLSRNKRNTLVPNTSNHRQRFQSFAANNSQFQTMKNQDKQKESDERCTLWDQINETSLIVNDAIIDVFEQSNSRNKEPSPEIRQNLIPISQTMQYFEKIIIEEIKLTQNHEETKIKAIRKFREVLEKFITRPWFSSAAFKQHSMITKTAKQLHADFKDLKRKGVFKILMKLLYKKILNHEFDEGKVNRLLQNLVDENLIPESFKRNVDARLEVYKDILEKMYRRNRSGSSDLPYLPDFIILKEQEYFQQLFHSVRDKILIEVKNIYDKIELSFFKERFQIYLKSDKVKPDEIISFLDEFNEQNPADDIRLDVFNCIKRMLKLSDRENTYNYIQKSLSKYCLPVKEENEEKMVNNLKEEAKVPYGFYFFHLFNKFQLDYTYEELINFTQVSTISENKFIIELIEKYSSDSYEMSKDYYGNDSCIIYFEQGSIEKIPDVQIHNQPLQFFGLVLHMLDALDFQIEEKQVFQLIMENYLQNNKFVELKSFIFKLKEYHLSEQNNLNSKNYQMISEFKEENQDVEKIFMDYVIEWFKRSYDGIQDVEQIDDKMASIDRGLNMVSTFNKSSALIRKQKAFFEMLTFIKIFKPDLITKVNFFKEEASKYSAFIFMMHIFQQIGLKTFTSLNEQQNNADKVEILFKIFEAFKEYTVLERPDYSNAEFIRLLIEICLVCIKQNEFQMAKYLILVKIPNDKYYFKDILFIFLAAAARDPAKSQSYIDSIKKDIMTPTTTSLIKNNLSEFINKFKINSFIMADKETFIKRSKEIMEVLFIKNCKDDAFFFMIRCKVLTNFSILSILKRLKTGSNDENQRERFQVEKQAYLLLVPYMKSLEEYIEQEFYPTYAFYESKLNMLIDPKERKDMIKDANIALSKLEKKINEEKSKNAPEKKQIKQSKITKEKLNKEPQSSKLEQTRAELLNSYEEYMHIIGEDPNIKLIWQDNSSQTEKKVDAYARTRTKDLFAEQTEQEINAKKELQKNLDRVNRVQEDNRLNVLTKDVSQKISEIKRATERHSNLESQIKRQDKEISIAERKAKQIEEIKKREREEIQSIKDTYKSNTTKRVNDLIENLRQKREKIQTHRYSPNSAVRDEEMKNTANIANIKPSFNNLMQPPAMLNNRKQFFIQKSNTNELRLENRLNDNTTSILPTTMRNRFDAQKDQPKKEENKILEIQKKMFPQEGPNLHQEKDIMTFKKKSTFEDVTKIYKEKDSADALKCIQKYDLLKNAQARVELIKRAYAVTNEIENFLEFIKFLTTSDDSWKESIEQKSIQIATQMFKMKNNINLKDLIPAQFFTTVQKVSLKDYYAMAFDIFKPNLKKIFEKELMAVHAVGILFRYALGNENKFYSRVFVEYFKVLLKNYQIKNMDEKDTFQLAEKLRTNYANLPENKEEKLAELFNQISSLPKRNKLLEALKKTLERKGESMMGSASNKEIAGVINRFLK